MTSQSVSDKKCSAPHEIVDLYEPQRIDLGEGGSLSS